VCGRFFQGFETDLGIPAFCPLRKFQRIDILVMHARAVDTALPKAVGLGQKKRATKQLNTFTELPLSSPMQRKLAASGFINPTPVQAAAIPEALQGKDVLATASTGTGKTLAFLLPIFENLQNFDQRGIAALVLVPTRELAIQVAAQYDALRDRKTPAAALVVGGMSENNQLQAIRKGARIVVATPGRLEDFLGRRLVDLRNVRILVLDEADRMLDMGFIPAIRRILSILPTKRQTMCFSATLEPSVKHLVEECMIKPVRIALVSTLKPAANVKMQAIKVSLGSKRSALQQILERETGRVLIFARTKRGTERLAKSLISGGISATMIHGDRSQSQRNAALAGFQQGRFQVLVATDVASRGIHVDDVAHVVNYDMPQIPEDFVHRVGRTARAGQEGKASLLFTAGSEAADLQVLERTLGIRIERTSMDQNWVEPARKADPNAPKTRTIMSLPGESFALSNRA
jgi:ATP-dependent RNA helicase RhlE